VLTDRQYFGGCSEDLLASRVNPLPILRKDFIIDPYQVEETKAMGADLMLLIAACLKPQEVEKLAALAHSLGLEVLLEIHNREELNHFCESIDYVGVNNRDLKTFQVDAHRSVELSEHIPPGIIKITESGIHQTSTIQMLRRYGYLGFLMGENFMKEPDPAIAFASFVNELKKEPYEGESLRHDAAGPGQKAG
jgi:indole-3-glycerol phosphate synthase